MLPRYAELWLPGLVAQALEPVDRPASTVHVYVCMADHFEPGWQGADMQSQRERVRAWKERYPACASRYRDADGRPPRHTFFFPLEHYHPEHLDALADLCHEGWGDVEVHLHHDHASAAQLEDDLESFRETLYTRHGLLRKDSTGKVRYGFIHGNWALNNARPDGRWCGVDDETSILMNTGCYADFTMPCGVDPSQSRQVNSIYYALPQKARRAQDKGPE